jgi:dachs protein
MQHFYNTHIFKSSIESCRDEGIHCEVEVDYVDNVPCIDLISSLVCDIKCVNSNVTVRNLAFLYTLEIRIDCFKHYNIPSVVS